MNTGVDGRYRTSRMRTSTPPTIHKQKRPLRAVSAFFPSLYPLFGLIRCDTTGQGWVTAWWQVSVARAIDRGNTEQQKGTDAVLREQLAAQQKLIAQQARDAAAMREAIAALKLSAQVVVPKKSSGTVSKVNQSSSLP